MMFIVLGLLASSYFYSTHGDTYYVGVQDDANWGDAGDICKAGVYINIKVSNGKLATWGSYGEYKNQIKSAYDLSGGGGVGAWVGLGDDPEVDGRWKFSDGDQTYCGPAPDSGGNCLNLQEWSDGEPNDQGEGGQDCALMQDVDTKKGDPNGLIDFGCANRKRFICEFDENAFRFTSQTYAGSKRSDAVPGIMPFETRNNNNYYVLQFTSMKDMVTFISIILNVALICYVGTRAFRKNTSAYYSSVKMSEDEQL